MSFFNQLFTQSYEIIVVLNGCVDNTEQIVDDFCNHYPQIKYINIPQAIGKGGAIIKGFEHAVGNYISFVDADNSVVPEQFFKIYQTILHPGVDCVIASRSLKDSKVVGKTISRQILSKGFNSIVNSIFDFEIKDTQCGGKIITREVYEKVKNHLYINNMAFDVNLLYAVKNSGFTIKEVPIKWVDDEVSTISNPLKISSQMLVSTINLKLKNYKPAIQN
ncbi:glycosyltransferase [Candidatus Gracilibacteria bacterium]|nr:glycosyltransferase [Candidatus Gracilibacteria bacterium]